MKLTLCRALLCALLALAAGCGKSSESRETPADDPTGGSGELSLEQLVAQILAHAGQLETAAERFVARGEALRDKAGELRALERELADEATRASVTGAIDALAEEGEAWARAGEELAATGDKLTAVSKLSAMPTEAAPGSAERRAAASEAMQAAAVVIAQADQLELGSTQFIARGNKIRKQIGKLRVAERRLDDEATRASVKKAIDVLVAEMDAWEVSGKELRDSGRQLGEAAHLLLINGFGDLWAKWLTNTAPLVMEAVEFEVVAHNTQIRTVQPSKLGAMPTAQEMPERYQGMSIRVPTLSGQNAPDELNVSSFQVSRERGFFVHVEVESSTDQPEPVPLNRIHQWRLLVSDMSGAPVEKAEIDIVGHMPGHVHGLPTQPQVTEEVAPGVYRVDGMKFQMNGWWVMQFNIKHGGKEDSARFNLVL